MMIKDEPKCIKAFRRDVEVENVAKGVAYLCVT